MENKYKLEIGKNYFIRSVTYHYVGKLVQIDEKGIWLEQCSWIADSGRFHDALHHGIDKNSDSEIEPFLSVVYLNGDSVVDMTEYLHQLPKKQK